MRGYTEIDSPQRWEEVINDTTIDEQDRKILDGLRDVFKIPVMRRTYGGSKPTFKKEFNLKASKRGKGAESIFALSRITNDTYTQQEVDALGLVLLEHGHVQDKFILMDLALGVDPHMKSVFTDYLQHPRSSEFFREGIEDIIEIWEGFLEAVNVYGPKEVKKGQTFETIRKDGSRETFQMGSTPLRSRHRSNSFKQEGVSV